VAPSRSPRLGLVDRQLPQLQSAHGGKHPYAAWFVSLDEE
jgi:hypothetical protein